MTTHFMPGPVVRHVVAEHTCRVLLKVLDGIQTRSAPVICFTPVMRFLLRRGVNAVQLLRISPSTHLMNERPVHGRGTA